jgi:hypothetical protein
MLFSPYLFDNGRRCSDVFALPKRNIQCNIITNLEVTIARKVLPFLKDSIGGAGKIYT